jgi:hypothetical protein
MIVMEDCEDLELGAAISPSFAAESAGSLSLIPHDLLSFCPFVEDDCLITPIPSNYPIQ